MARAFVDSAKILANLPRSSLEIAVIVPEVISHLDGTRARTYMERAGLVLCNRLHIGSKI